MNRLLIACHKAPNGVWRDPIQTVSFSRSHIACTNHRTNTNLQIQATRQWCLAGLDCKTLGSRRGLMDGQAIVDGSRNHSIFTWSAGRDVQPLALASAEGSWLTLADGHRLLDFNSQSMNANLGHKHPHMVKTLKAQLDALPHAAPAFATQLRAEVSQALSATLPKALNKILYCFGGARRTTRLSRSSNVYRQQNHQQLSQLPRSYPRRHRQQATHAAGRMNPALRVHSCTRLQPYRWLRGSRPTLMRICSTWKRSFAVRCPNHRRDDHRTRGGYDRVLFPPKVISLGSRPPRTL